MINFTVDFPLFLPEAKTAHEPPKALACARDRRNAEAAARGASALRRAASVDTGGTRGSAPAARAQRSPPSANFTPTRVFAGKPGV